MSEWDRIQNNLSTISRENQRIEFHPATKPHTSFNISSKLTAKKIEEKSSINIKKQNAANTDLISGPVPGLFSPAIVFDFLHWRKISRGGSGLYNHGNTCFLNSVLQCLLHVPALTQILLNEKIGSSILNTVKNTKSVIHYYHRLVHEVWVQSIGKAVSPRCIVQNIRQIGRQFRPTRQEDAHEFLRQLLDTMHEEILKATRIKTSDGKISETSLICRIFGGYLQNHLKCPQCPYSSRTYNHFQDLSLEISGQINSIEEALSEYSRPEKLGSGNEWACEGCKRRVLAIKQLTVCRAPAVLVLHLKRFSFGGRSSKIIKKIKIDEYLHLNLSDENSSDILHSQYGYKQKQKHQSPNTTTTTNNKSGFSTSSSSSSNNNYGSSSSNGHESVKYKLIGVVVHHGMSMHSGHYIAYVRASNDQWLLMDDNHVSVTSLKNVLDQQAYILFYTQVVPVPIPAPAPVPLVPLPNGASMNKSIPNTTTDSSTTPLPTTAITTTTTTTISNSFPIDNKIKLEKSTMALTSTNIANPTIANHSLHLINTNNSIINCHTNLEDRGSIVIHTIQSDPNTALSYSSSSNSITKSVLPMPVEESLNSSNNNNNSNNNNISGNNNNPNNQLGNSNVRESSNTNLLLNGHINNHIINSHEKNLNSNTNHNQNHKNSMTSSAMDIMEEKEEDDEILSDVRQLSSLSLISTKQTKTRLVTISSDKIRVHRFLSPYQRLMKWVKGNGSRLPLLRRRKVSLNTTTTTNNNNSEEEEEQMEPKSNTSDYDSQEVSEEEEDEEEEDEETSQYDDNITSSSNNPTAKNNNNNISLIPMKSNSNSISTTMSTSSSSSTINNNIIILNTTINPPDNTRSSKGDHSNNHHNQNISKLLSLLGKRGKGELEEGHWEHIHPNIITEKEKMKISQHQAEQNILENRQTSEWNKMLDRGKVKKMKTNVSLLDNSLTNSDNNNNIINNNNNPFQNVLDNNNNKSHFNRNVFGYDVSNNNNNFKEGRKSKYKKY